MLIPIKEKLLSTITAHPKLITFGIGLAITFAVGTAIEMLDHQQVSVVTVLRFSRSKTQGNNNVKISKRKTIKHNNSTSKTCNIGMCLAITLDAAASIIEYPLQHLRPKLQTLNNDKLITSTISYFYPMKGYNFNISLGSTMT